MPPSRAPARRATRSLDMTSQRKTTAPARMASPTSAADCKPASVPPRRVSSASATTGSANLTNVFHSPVTTEAMAIEPALKPNDENSV